jgi:alkanesulfonate monooxygenase SsuD/methylene tetrahydromethanopterin reductase-like flavin-dependent oxidoreductase (luciferase family)
MPASAGQSIGILLPTREQAIGGGLQARSLLDVAREAERLGFDSLWAGDSLIARPRLDPLVVLSAAAAVTDRIGIGTAAFTPALRHPLIAANMIASLDQIAGGRLALGLGSGFPIPETRWEFAAVGASYTGRAGRLDETVQLWRQAWHGGKPDTSTDVVGVDAENLSRLQRPARPGGPLLWLAGSDTPAVLRRVAQHYDGWLPYLPSATAYRQAVQSLEKLREEAGRPAGAITPALYATITVNRDEAKAQAELEDYVQRYYNAPLREMAQIQAYGWGSAQQCADWIADYVQAGAKHIVIRIGSLQSFPLEEVATTVLPALPR